MKQIKCCIKCVAPKRHPGCHGTCEEYLKEKELCDQDKHALRKAKDKEEIVYSVLSKKR